MAPSTPDTPPRYGAHVTRAAWPDPLFLDDPVVVLRLGSESEAATWIREQDLPTVRLAGRVAIRRKALLSALAAREVSGG